MNKIRKFVALLGFIVALRLVSLEAANPVFSVSFDGNLKSAGTDCTWKGKEKAVFQEGYADKALLLRSDEYEVEYTGDFISDDLMRSGSIVFWFNPTDWDPLAKEDHSIYPFMLSDGKGNNVFIYIASFSSPQINSHIGLYVDTAGQNRAAGYPALEEKHGWGMNKWVQVAITWDHFMGEAKVYINDNLLTTLALPLQWSKSAEMGKENPSLKIGAMNCKQPLCHALIEKLTIYKQVLSLNDISDLWNSLESRVVLAKKFPVPTVVVPRVITPVTLDGTLEEELWKKASVVPVMGKNEGINPATRSSWALLAYDNDNLYVGFKSEIGPEGVNCKAKTKNEALFWKDDSFEIFLCPSQLNWDSNVKQLIVSSGNVHWQGTGIGHQLIDVLLWHSKTKITRTLFTAEVVIPFSSLGWGTPKENETWQAELCRNWNNFEIPEYVSWASSPSSYGSRTGTLIFGREEQAIKFTFTNTLQSGQADLVLNTGAGFPENCELTAEVEKDTGIILEKTFPVEAKKPVDIRIKEKIKDLGWAILKVALNECGSKKEIFSHATTFEIAPPLSMLLSPDIEKKVIKIALKIRPEVGTKWKTDIESGNCLLETAIKKSVKSEEVLKTERFPIHSLNETLILKWDWWEEGNYEIAVSLKNKSVPPGAISRTFSVTIPPLSWYGNDLGKSDEVLSPWSPLEYSKPKAVSCWGRTYTFAGPFPSQITNQNKALLAGPIRMVLKTDKGEVELKEKNFKVSAEKPNRFEFEGKGEFAGLGGEVLFNGWMEYDGLTVSNLKLIPPKGGWQVQSLLIKIPLRPDLAKYIRTPRRIPWNGERWESEFLPYVWVGTEYEGFDWFMPSDANWLYKKGEKTVILNKDPGNTTVTLKIISTPVLVNIPLDYQIGFQATPVKPITEDVRCIRAGTFWAPGYKHNYNGDGKMNATLHTYTGIYHGIHFPPAPGIREDVGNFFQNKIRLFYYMHTFTTDGNDPVYKFFEKEWQNPRAWGSGFLKPVCAGAKSYTDYLRWQAHEILSRLPEASYGIYVDIDGLYFCGNQNHGCGYTDAFGRKGLTTPFLQTREYYKRLLAICRHTPKPKGFLWLHQHDYLVLPYDSFGDLWFPGEQYSLGVYTNPWFYMETLDPVAWRVELSGRASGIEHVFLPQIRLGPDVNSDFNEYREDKISIMESIITMLFLHNIPFSNIFSHVPTGAAYWDLRDRLGCDTATFLAFWEEGCPVQTKQEKALASIYYFPGTKAICVVGNLSSEDKNVPVTIDLNKLGLNRQNLIGKEERTGQPVEIKENKFTVTVKSHNYTVVSIQ
ncbi:MAG: glycoside hydrolase domain-containing protein [Candidatus Omnitrophota bacterium]